MASNKHKGSLSLQQVLDSNLNDDPENDFSEEESSEEEFDYDDIVTEDGQSLLQPLCQTSPFYLVDMTTYLVTTATNRDNVSNIQRRM